jgi:hypothetical protein
MNYFSNSKTDLDIAGNFISWISGLLFFATGIINTTNRNDQQFGIFILIISLIYFIPVNEILKKIT